MLEAQGEAESDFLNPILSICSTEICLKSKALSLVASKSHKIVSSAALWKKKKEKGLKTVFRQSISHAAVSPDHLISHRKVA